VFGSLIGRSLERQLIVRIVAIFLVAFVAIFSGLVYRVFSAVEELDDIALQAQARDIAGVLKVGTGDAVTLDLPAYLREDYAQGSGARFFAVLRADGTVALSSNPDASASLLPDPTASLRPGRFLFAAGSTPRAEYIGYLHPAGGYWIAVAQRRDPAERGIVASVLEEYIEAIAWWVLAIMVVAAGMCVWTVRSMFKPLAQEAARVRNFDIASPSADLPVSRFPSEVAPFAEAVNAAFKRIRDAYWLQQRFISDAAHQLRTPLAVLTARLEAATAPIEGKTVLRDVARVNRIVGQLLMLTRLDARSPDVSGHVDLVALARDVVGYMAPYIARQGREIELQAGPEPVPIHGDYHALFDALQNLVENAAQASPAGGVVRVAVTDAGEIGVLDRGCGVSAADRERLFDRFWRSKRNAAPGSGLGLSIVRKIVDAHGGIVAVEDRDGGGMAFTLRFPPKA
jgi:signal transduction histidine kinase